MPKQKTAAPTAPRATPRLDPEAGSPHTRGLTTRALSVRAATVNDDARTVDAVISTETPAVVYDGQRGRMIQEVLVAEGAVLPEQMPLLENHYRWSLDSVYGSIREMRIEREGKESKVVGTLVFAEDEDSERAWQKVRGGHLTDVSVGYRVDEYTDIPPGQRKLVAGRYYTAPEDRTLRISTKWTAREGSLVPIGADPNAKIRETPEATSEGGAMRDETNPGHGPTSTEAHAMPASKKNSSTPTADGQRNDAEASANTAPEGNDATQGQRGDSTAPTGEQTPVEGQRSAPSGDDGQRAGATPLTGQTQQSIEQVRREAADAERLRIDGIRGLANPNTPQAAIDHCINQRLSVEQAGHYILMEERKMGHSPVNAPAVHTRSDDALAVRNGIAASLLLRGGDEGVRQMAISDGNGRRLHGEELAKAQERAGNDADRFAYRSLTQLAEDAMRAEGRSTVFGNRSDFMRSAFSTPTLVNAFTTNINAQVVMAWEDARQDDTTGWCEEGEVNDFKSHSDISRTPTSGLQRLPRGSQSEHTTFSDEAETYQAYRYGEQGVFDEQDMIDDRFDVLTETPREFAEDAAQVRPDLVYALLLANGNLSDGGALFNSTAVTTTGGHANLTTAVLASAGLKAGITAMRKQVWGSRRLNIRPRHLLIPPDLDFTADELVNSSQILIAGDTDTERGNRNTLANRGLMPHSEQRLGAAGVVDPITGTTYTGSATNWFLAANRRTVKVVYMRGTGRRPEVRTWRLTSDGRYGVGYDIKLDIGAFARDFRGVHKSTGAG